MANKLTEAQKLALELHEEREKRRVKTYTITNAQWAEINKPHKVDPKNLPPVIEVTIENDHPFKDTHKYKEADKVIDFLMDTASEVLDEMTEEEQEARYHEDMDRLYEEFLRQDEREDADKETADDTSEDWTFDDEDFEQDFKKAVEKRRKRQGANPLTGGSHHCRYIKPEWDEEMSTIKPETTDEIKTLREWMSDAFMDELRSVVREEVERALDEFADIYRFETFLQYEQNQREKQLKKDIEQIDYHNRIERFDKILDRLEKASK